MSNSQTSDANKSQPVLNEFGSETESSKDQWKSWVLTAGIAVAIVLAVSLYRANKDGNEEKASQMLGEARNVQAMQAIMSQYPSTAAAKLALLQTAKAQYDNGDVVSAQASYQDFLSKNPTHPMASIAELGKIHCTEALGQPDAALVAYNQFAATHPHHFLMPMALFGKARCLQTLKRFTEARTTYEDFLAANPKSLWINDVEEAMKQLERDARRPLVKL
ncbi:MAG: tetratricopeptide repeat protein [bacterium]